MFLDLPARTLIATIPISKKVQRISISPDGKSVFTQDQETPRIVVIDTATNAVVRSISLPRIPFSSAVTKDGRWLLANSESGKLFVVDVASGVLTKTFDTPDIPVLPTPGEFVGTRRPPRLSEPSAGWHHRDPESERLEARRAHSAHKRRGRPGLGAFGHEFSSLRHPLTPE